MHEAACRLASMIAQDVPGATVASRRRGILVSERKLLLAAGDTMLVASLSDPRVQPAAPGRSSTPRSRCRGRAWSSSPRHLAGGRARRRRLRPACGGQRSRHLPRRRDHRHPGGRSRCSPSSSRSRTGSPGRPSSSGSPLAAPHRALLAAPLPARLRAGDLRGPDHAGRRCADTLERVWSEVDDHMAGLYRVVGTIHPRRRGRRKPAQRRGRGSRGRPDRARRRGGPPDRPLQEPRRLLRPGARGAIHRRRLRGVDRPSARRAPAPDVAAVAAAARRDVARLRGVQAAHRRHRRHRRPDRPRRSAALRVGGDQARGSRADLPPPGARRPLRTSRSRS